MSVGTITRTRTLPGVSTAYERKIFGSVQAAAFVHPISRIEVTTSEDHPERKLFSGKWDVGGPFETQKISYDLDETVYQMNANWYGGPYGWQYAYRSQILPSMDLLAAFGDISTDAARKSFVLDRCNIGLRQDELDALGTKAVSITKPTNPAVDLATALAELWSERKFFSTPGMSDSLSGEYLNYSFGIAPTVSTIQDFRTAIASKDKIIQQYKRDSGRWVRRKFRFDPDVSSSSTRADGVYPWVHSDTNVYLTEPGTLLRNTRTETNSWFSGAFQYTIPKGWLPESMAELDRLYGVVPGISTGWELIPFSWLVDYFVPVGALLSNIDAFNLDGLILPYGYLMSTTEVVDEYSWSGRIKDASGNWVNRTISSTVTTSRKRRIHANPFGFGILPGGLNLKQTSILVALGLSRA